MPHKKLQPQLSENARKVVEKRYLKRDADGKPLETPADMLMRVADTIAAADKTFSPSAKTQDIASEFYRMMANLEFLPNSPTLMNAGRELGQLSACFVLPIGDSIEEIFDAVKFTAMIHKSGGGTGFSFSRLRPVNDLVKTTTGVSSGPVSFMRIFDTATETVKQGGTRRGANMGILRIDHPDIMQFIACKDDQTQYTNFNISVGLTEAFMEAVEQGGDYDLINPRDKKPVGKLNAREVYEKIVSQAWRNGEPGIIFLDRLNRDNPTPRVGEIEATNPCGEQPLLPYESCNLGSINLAKHVKNGDVDWDKLKMTVHNAVHFLDNVIEANKYPLQQIHDMTHANRKIGLGVMGWADMLIMLGISYGSEMSIDLGALVMKFINAEGHKASQKLADLRGTFPNYSGSIFDKPVRGGQKKKMRNATVTTIAPTGTISMIANASSGVEPLFAVTFERRQMDIVMYETNPLFEKIAKERGFWSEEVLQAISKNHGSVKGIAAVPADVQAIFTTAHDVTPEQHVKMQAAFQQHTDNAVSKTVNFSSEATIEDVDQVYRLAYKTGCKGVTIYRDGSRDNQVLSTGSQETVVAPVLPVETSKHTAKRDRPKALKGWTYQMQTGCGPLYVTVNEDENGLFELFTTMGKAGGCAASQSEAIGRMVSLAWRSGVQAKQVVKQLLGISCHCPAGFGDNKVLSCADAVAKAIQSHMIDNGYDMEKETVTQDRGACRECGGPIEHEGGCNVCKVCGASDCG